MTYTACLLRFKSGLHLGERETWREGSSEIVHSDTLFSAYCHGYRLLFGEQELERLLTRFLEGEYPFLMSSAFPFWKGIYYLPTPRCHNPASKEQKKIIYIGMEDWWRLNGGSALGYLGSKVPVLRKGNFPWKVIDVPRVGLNRLTAHPDDAFFHFGEVWYEKDAGLFFIFQVAEAQEEVKFRAVWRLLAHEGLGGDRSVGKGHFHIPEFKSLQFPDCQESSHSVCLSLYYPAPSELTGLNEGYYELIDRRGYIFSPAGQSLRRKPVRFFTEGSVFPNPPVRRGTLVDVTPPAFTAHPVYRCGILFSLPCLLPGGVS